MSYCSTISTNTVNSFDLYKQETRSIPWLSDEDEIVYQERARSGDTAAREALILDCLNYVASVATHYARYAKHDDILDLIGIGNLILVENIDHALTRPNPAGYLRMRAKYAIIGYISTKAHLVACPSCKHPPMRTLSLDSDPAYYMHTPAPQPEQRGKEPDYSKLYEAVERLPASHREALTCAFGLYDTEPTSLYALSRNASANVKGTSAYLTRDRALRSLRKEMAQVS